MNLPFFFLKSLQKMSYRVKGHKDHTQQSIFHNGLIKLIVNTILQEKVEPGNTFCFGQVSIINKKINPKRGR